MQYIERYKQAFGRPGVPTAALNYYRAVNNALFPTEKLHRWARRAVHAGVAQGVGLLGWCAVACQLVIAREVKGIRLVATCAFLAQVAGRQAAGADLDAMGRQGHQSLASGELLPLLVPLVQARGSAGSTVLDWGRQAVRRQSL